jgi:MOSC domain-containing protein YiiM
MTGTLVAVCAVHALLDGHSSVGRTAIDKRPLDGPVEVDATGIVADTQCDAAHHGGIDQAVYAYSREEAERWATELGVEVAPGSFGENLAVRGLPVTDAVVGERWLVGQAVLLEVTLPRVPCQTFKSWMGQPRWVKRFTDRGDTGTYLRVLGPGTVQAGDTIEVVARPGHGVTVRELFRAAEQDPRRLRRMMDELEYVAERAERLVRRGLGAAAQR